jgi:hypothetical protein
MLNIRQHLPSELGVGQSGTVGLGHEQALQHDSVEVGASATSQEPVQLQAHGNGIHTTQSPREI